MEQKPLQWHPAFCSTLQIELAGEPLQFINEYNLTSKPLQIDVLIIKKQKNRRVQKQIGRFFRTHNIMEFKNPTDYFSINDYYKVLGYACIYQANTEKIMEIPPDEITISLVMNHFPRKMLDILYGMYRMDVNKVYPGIYYLDGLTFPTQIIIIKELSKKDHQWLSRLRPGLSITDDLNVLMDEYKDKQSNPLYLTSMDVIVRANHETCAKEEKKMCDALLELFDELYGDKLKKEVEETVARELEAAVARELEAAVAKELEAAVARELEVAVAREVAKETERASTITIIDFIRKLMKKDTSKEQIADVLDLDSGFVNQIFLAIRALAPDSSTETVYAKWKDMLAAS